MCNHKDKEAKEILILLLSNTKAIRVLGDLPDSSLVRVICKKHPTEGKWGVELLICSILMSFIINKRNSRVMSWKEANLRLELPCLRSI
jgi:hypothetical protein